ncbi:sensor histidine kinase [Massilia sp. ST3]|uniref:sensor histidine kinase n=1 Tax=Massilia sp. ST3 TaxID=2824903 RepID=UPI001B838CC4|nr:histidine kinase [Massilia sp. ST3]MBQ5949049.1 histidine kinase [Massilia sp. ST3]
MSFLLRPRTEEADALPAGPLAVLSRVAGADRGVPWPGLACAAALSVASWFLATPLLAKLMAALLAPVLATWCTASCAAWLARRFAPAGRYWIVCWAWAILALLLGVAGAAAVHAYAMTPRELIVFARRDMLVLALLVWCCVLALPLALLQRQAYRSEVAALRLSALGAELKALQAQVEPHFLYNTLANTRYLARHQPERAVEMLDHLIAYLHQALPDMRSRTSTVDRECALAGHYLALMAIRFGERLRYTVDVAEDARDAEMPPLLLISLVENAVRHGVEPTPGAASVSIRAVRKGGQLRLTVADDGPGPGARSPVGHGVGLRNARERLRALYGEAASLELERGPDQLTRAELVLPARGAPSERLP